MKATITLLPGDGIGPEVIQSAVAVLRKVADTFGHEFQMETYLIGGAAIDRHGVALPEPTLDACRKADAILLGAVGGPKWDDPTAPVRPEQGLLALRLGLGAFANLRPVKLHPDLLDASPLRPERLQNVDLMVVRELTGGIYYGKPRLRRSVHGELQALDTMIYSESEVRRIAHLAFQLAQGRRKMVTSIDKANVLECSRLWRQVVSQVGEDYPDIVLNNVLVDAAAMFLVTNPASFDVILTPNMFGDILSDEASVLSGSMGNMPSASLGEDQNGFGLPRGVYEPMHGSAPTIAGKGIANPIGTILSAAFLLRYSLGLEKEAQSIEYAVDATLSAGSRTVDLAQDRGATLSTSEITDVIIGNIKE
jgi:3-isopropylmalate dehydrogenase